MVIKLGIIGLSEGNGHPFSFAAIINGYSEIGMKNSGWDVIYHYVKMRDASEFGFEGVKVTHAWTQEKDVTKRLCDACKIENVVENFLDMINEVDGVIIARDDYERHYEFAMPFLKCNKFVFIDKPLSLNREELEFFKPYLKNGRLMSCSGMRYAKELDGIRELFKKDDEFKLIRGTIINSWTKYGVHLLDAIFSFNDFAPKSIKINSVGHESITIETMKNELIQIDCIENGPMVFRLDIVRSDGTYTVNIEDNFSMFRRTLWHFTEMIKNAKLPINPATTLKIMNILIYGQEKLMNDN